MQVGDHLAGSGARASDAMLDRLNRELAARLAQDDAANTRPLRDSTTFRTGLAKESFDHILS
jgi:hypothetical protein